MKYLIHVALGACCFAVLAQKGVTQTVFAWPEAKVDLKTYLFFDDCVANGGRSLDGVDPASDSVKSSVDRDLVYKTPRQPKQGLREEAQMTMRECLSKFSPTQIPRNYTVLAIETYLKAGQVMEAEAAVLHGLNQIPTTDSLSRFALLDSTIEKLVKTPPFQLHLVQAYIDTLERYGEAVRPWNLWRNYFWLMFAAYMSGDDSLALKAGRRVVDLGPAAAKSAKGGELVAVQLYLTIAIRITKERELLDSLRVGTAAYAALMTANIKQGMGFVPTGLIRDEEAPVLAGDYWFPDTAATQEYPRKGRVSLVVFVHSRSEGGTGPADLLSRLRVMKEKYPTVDLVLVTWTKGDFGPLEPPSTEREAFLSDSVYRDFHRLNPVLSVTKGVSVRFDPPDNRKFDQPFPNFDAYPPSGGDLFMSGKLNSIYLVDENRRIVERLQGGRLDLDLSLHLIETLLARIAGKSQ